MGDQSNRKMLQSGKIRLKKWSYLSGLHVSFLIHGPKIVQKSSFLQFCADLSKKPKSVKAIYINAS